MRAFIQIGYPESLGAILTDVSCIVLLGSILCVHCKCLLGITVIPKTLLLYEEYILAMLKVKQCNLHLAGNWEIISQGSKFFTVHVGFFLHISGA